jgi:hypothetical protein
VSPCLPGAALGVPPPAAIAAFGVRTEPFGRIDAVMVR